MFIVLNFKSSSCLCLSSVLPTRDNETLFWGTCVFPSLIWLRKESYTLYDSNCKSFFWILKTHFTSLWAISKMHFTSDIRELSKTLHLQLWEVKSAWLWYSFPGVQNRKETVIGLIETRKENFCVVFWKKYDTKKKFRDRDNIHNSIMFVIKAWKCELMMFLGRPYAHFPCQSVWGTS